MIRSILVPLDFSEFAPLLAEKAVAIAHQLGASLTLMHVYELPGGMTRQTMMFPRGRGAPLTVQAWIEEDFEQRTPELEKLAARLGAKTTHRLEFGHPGQVICQVAEREQFDLVIMGTHGRSGIRRALSGSVAEEVIRHSACPVLTFRIPSELQADSALLEQSGAELQLRDESDG
jgi:nucleotide-binding universal stress UspA family protein